MQIEKKKIVELPMVYVTAQLQLGGKQYLAVASEAPGEHAYIIDPETGRYADLWKGDTGVMNIVQIPGTEKLLVIVRFYPIFQSREAAVCLLEPGKDGYMGQWNIREVAKVPFCHRIGVVSNPHGKFLLACQLCADKDFQEDWSKPGSLWTAPIRDDGVGMSPETLRELSADSRYKDHYGIYNVRERLRLFYGEGTDVTVTSREEQGTCVKITIGKKRLEQERY